MKKIIYVILLTSSTEYVCSEEIKTGMISTFKKNPNNFYFGPEVFWFDMNTHFKQVGVQGSKTFLGLRLGYEYLNPDAFYFGITILAAGANHGFHESYRGIKAPQSNGFMGFGNFELKFGYTISAPRWLTTPFLCLGGYSVGSGTHFHHFREGMSYLGGGVRARYECSQAFNLGINFKVFASIYREEKWKYGEYKRTIHNGAWAGEIGIPLIWRVGSLKKWDIQLEPYFLKLRFTEIQNIYGARLLFGYRF